MAYLTTLNGLLLAVEDRVVARLDPDFLTTFGDALVLSGVVFAAPQFLPEAPVFIAAVVGGFDKHAVMLALDLFEAVAEGLQEIIVGSQNRPVELEFDDRPAPC